VANVTTSPSISKFQGYVSGSSSMVLSGGVHDGGRFVEHIQRGRSGKRGADGLTGNTTTITAKQSGRLHPYHHAVGIRNNRNEQIHRHNQNKLYAYNQ
jgi:hypothetical protein